MIEAETNVAPLGLDPATSARFSVTPERLADYLDAHVPDMAGATVTSLQQVVGGLSKETFLFDVHKDQESFGLVLRRDIPNPPIQSSATDEFAVLQPLVAKLRIGALPSQPCAADRTSS